MNPKKLLLLFLYLIGQLTHAQSEKWMQGKIVVKDASPQGVHVINLVNEKETVSGPQGEFRIQAKPEDLLVFSSSHLDYQRKIIESDDYRKASVTIEMTAKVTQLEEVKIIKPVELDPVKLGILPRPAKRYTQAERHLRTAGDFKPIHLLAILGGQLPVDPILNAINGRTKILKKALLTEREIALLTILDDTFADDYYTGNLNIAPEYIDGFKYYAIKDQNLAQALRTKNKATIEIAIVPLAQEYNKQQQSDEPLNETHDKTNSNK